MTVIVIFLVFAGIVGVLWVGANDVRAGAMTPGELVQFVIYAVIVAGAVGRAVRDLGRAAARRRRDRAAGRTAGGHRQRAGPRARAPLPRPVRGASPSNVRFHYPTRPEQSALDGVSLRVRPGETVALVGPSGAGKTTIIQLLLRFYDPQAGASRSTGVDLRDLPGRLARAMALVPQDPVIFATTGAREHPLRPPRRHRRRGRGRRPRRRRA
jgi:ATP-binding cassette, subfamily B, bacterial